MLRSSTSQAISQVIKTSRVESLRDSQENSLVPSQIHFYSQALLAFALQDTLAHDEERTRVELGVHESKGGEVIAVGRLVARNETEHEDEF